MYHNLGEVPKWSNGADCKSVVYDFEGSNPSLSTDVSMRCGCRIVAITSAFQAEEVGSIPITRSFAAESPSGGIGRHATLRG